MTHIFLSRPPVQVSICVPSDPTWCTNYNLFSAAALTKLGQTMNVSAYRCEGQSGAGYRGGAGTEAGLGTQ